MVVEPQELGVPLAVAVRNHAAMYFADSPLSSLNLLLSFINTGINTSSNHIF